MKRLQRWTALFLALLMLVSVVPFAAAEASTTTLFSQDFDNVDAAVPTDWTQVVRSGSGKWTAATHDGSGALTINTSAGSDNIITTQAGNTNWTDYTYSADISVGGESVSPGLIVRCQEDSKSFYTVLYTVNNGVHSLRAYRFDDLKPNGLTGEYVISTPPAYGTTIKLAVEVAGNVITAYLNGTEVYSWTDTANSYPSGGVGLRIYTVDPAQKAYYANPKVVDSNSTILMDKNFGTDPLENWKQATGSFAIKTLSNANHLANAGTGNNIITVGDSAWTDYEYSANMVVSGNAVSPTMLVRTNDAGNQGYGFLYTTDSTGGYLKLYKITGGSYSEKTSAPYTLNFGTTYQMSVKAVGNTITGYVNGTEVLSWTDPDHTYSAGKVGLRVRADETDRHVYLSDPSVVTATEDGPVTPPSGGEEEIAVLPFSQNFLENTALTHWTEKTGTWKVEAGKGLTTSKAGTTGIITAGASGWVNYTYSAKVSYTGAQAAPGLLFRYQESSGGHYMFVPSPTDNNATLHYTADGSSYTPMKTVPLTMDLSEDHVLSVAVCGSEIRCSVDGTEIIKFYDSRYTTGKVGVRLRTGSDSMAYVEELSVEKYPEQPLFFEPFDTLDTGKWSVGSNFVLRQSQGTNWLTGGTVNGAIALVSGVEGASNWSNYEVRAHVRLEGNGEHNCPGLVFGAKSSSDFYWVHISKADQDIKLYRHDGKNNEIASAELEVKDNSTYELKVHVYNSVITCYVDGITYIQHDTKSTGVSGTVGMRNYTNGSSAEFSMLDNILVYPVTGKAEIVTNMPEGVSFYDGFENGLDKWSGSGFTVSDGVASGEGKLLTGETIATQYRLETVILNGDGEMGVTTHGGAYKAGINFDTDTVYLYKGDKVVAQKAWEFSDKTVLAITVNGNKVSVWADESKMMDYTDEDAKTAAGQFGIWASGSSAGSFDSVMTREIWIPDVLPGDEPYDLAPDPIAAAPTVGDATYYVALNGKDTWSGTLDHPNADGTDGPFATIEAAAAAAANNEGHDTVLIRGGTYYLDNTITLTSGNVTFAAYPGETPVISGGQKVTSAWTKQEGSEIWVTELPAEFSNVEIRQLFVEDQRATRSREPDETVWTISSVDTGNYSWIVPNGAILDSWADLTGVEMNSRGGWHYNRQEVDRFDVTNNKVFTKQYIGVQASGLKIKQWAGDWLFFENALLFVDTEGEWFYDDVTNKLYYYPIDDADPNEQEIVIPVLETLVEVGSETPRVEELDFYGLTFQHTTWSMNPYDGVFSGYERRGIQAGFWGNLRDDPVCAPPAALLYTNTNRCRIQNNLFAHLGEGAIAFGANADSNLIYANEFDDVGANVIQVGWRATYTGEGHPLEKDWDTLSDAPIGNEIVQNYIHDSCVTDQGSVGIWTGYSNHNLISHNTIENMPYSGLNVGWRWTGPEAANGEPEAGPDYNPPYNATTSHHNVIAWNWAVRSMQSMADGGGLYFVGEQYGNKVINNWVSESKGHGLYFDEKSNHTEVAYNYYGNDLFQNRNRWFMDIHDNYSGSPADQSLYGAAISSVGRPTGGLFAVTFTMTPANAVLTVNNEVKTDRSFQLPAGTYSYTVTASGYEDLTGTFTVADGPVDILVNLEQDAVARVVAQIEALPDENNVTLDDAAAITAAKTAFDALTNEQKTLVSNAEKLTAAVEKITELQQDAADAEAAAEVDALIDALPDSDEVQLSEKEDVAAARKAFDDLTDDQEALVSDAAKDKLEALEDRLDELQAKSNLEQAKTEAKAELAAYRAAKADADYRDAQVAELNNAVTAGNAAIDAATTEAAVAKALAAAKAALDAVKTDVELDAEEENEKPNWPVYPGTPSKPSAPAKPVNPVKEFTFKDVVESDWYYDEVKDAFENGLIDGMTADSFAPNKELTVAQAIKLAAALHQLDKLGRVNLENGTDTWYSTYVRYAVANEIIGEKYATYTKAQMNDPISREEFVHIFHGAMEYYAEKNDVADNAIPDVKLSDDYANEIYTFYRAGILTGSDAKGTFYPNSSIKRSEVAAILIRMYDKTARQFVTLG